MRVDHAAELPSLPIGEVAQVIGFNEHGYLAQTFHKMLDQSPSAYRHKHAIGMA
jgi:YesN/AraC family two-component response regulator